MAARRWAHSGESLRAGQSNHTIGPRAGKACVPDDFWRLAGMEEAACER